MACCASGSRRCWATGSIFPACADARLRRDLQSLSTVRGASLSWLPEMAVLRVESKSGAPKYFTLLRNTAHLNVTHLAREEAQLVPAENTLTVVPGFIGAYPNAMFRVQDNELPALEAAVRGLASEADYRALADRFAVRRRQRVWPPTRRAALSATGTVTAPRALRRLPES